MIRLQKHTTFKPQHLRPCYKNVQIRQHNAKRPKGATVETPPGTFNRITISSSTESTLQKLVPLFMFDICTTHTHTQTACHILDQKLRPNSEIANIFARCGVM